MSFADMDMFWLAVFLHVVISYWQWHQCDDWFTGQIQKLRVQEHNHAGSCSLLHPKWVLGNLGCFENNLQMRA